MSRPATGRTTKLVRVPIRFEAQVKAFIRALKQKEDQGSANQNQTQARTSTPSETVS